MTGVMFNKGRVKINFYPMHIGPYWQVNLFLESGIQTWNVCSESTQSEKYNCGILVADGKGYGSYKDLKVTVQLVYGKIYVCPVQAICIDWNPFIQAYVIYQTHRNKLLHIY